MVPRENKSNAYANFWRENKEYYGIFESSLFFGRRNHAETGSSCLGIVNKFRRIAVGLYDWTKKWIYIKFAQRKHDGKLCLLQSKPAANAVNAIFGTIFTMVCKYGSKYGIYRVCYRFALEQT